MSRLRSALATGSSPLAAAIADGARRAQASRLARLSGRRFGKNWSGLDLAIAAENAALEAEVGEAYPDFVRLLDVRLRELAADQADTPGAEDALVLTRLAALREAAAAIKNMGASETHP